jgi:hypothetical protein
MSGRYDEVYVCWLIGWVPSVHRRSWLLDHAARVQGAENRHRKSDLTTQETMIGLHVSDNGQREHAGAILWGIDSGPRT